MACHASLQHDHGSQFMSGGFQSEIRFFGIQSSPVWRASRRAAAVCSASSPPSRNSCFGSEISPRWTSWPEHSDNFPNATTTTGCWERSSFNPLGSLVRGCLPSRLLHHEQRFRNRLFSEAETFVPGLVLLWPRPPGKFGFDL